MIEEIKLVLGLKDEAQDELLSLLIKQTESRLMVILGTDHIPQELDYIVNEVVIIRYNKIGSEGVSNHSIDGESLTFGTNDFDEFMDDIQAWRDSQKEQTIGKLRFL